MVLPRRSSAERAGELNGTMIPIDGAPWVAATAISGTPLTMKARSSP